MFIQSNTPVLQQSFNQNLVQPNDQSICMYDIKDTGLPPMIIKNNRNLKFLQSNNLPKYSKESLSALDKNSLQIKINNSIRKQVSANHHLFTRKKISVNPFVKTIPQKKDLKNDKSQQSNLKMPNKRQLAQTIRQHQLIQKDSYFDKYLTNPTLLNSFKMLSHIGKGCFSIVSLAVDKNTNNSYAIKTYTKITDMDWYKLDNIKKQIKNLLKVRHQNIVELIYVIKDKRKILLVMENAGKQSLAGILRKSSQSRLSEEITKKYFKQILEGVKHCHDQGICHRDIKPQNILVNDDQTIKIIDFGFSTHTKQKLSTFCGTPPFMSPQLAKKTPYLGQCADVWALGVLLYLMLFGKFPFRANDQKQLFRIIQQGKYKIADDTSPSIKLLLSQMLKCDENQRSTIDELLKSSWFK